MPRWLDCLEDCTAAAPSCVAGFFFGRTPLIKLSPKKTWEGFVGGFLGTLVIAFFLSAYLAQFKWMTCPRKVRHGRMDAEDGIVTLGRYTQKPWGGPVPSISFCGACCTHGQAHCPFPQAVFPQPAAGRCAVPLGSPPWPLPSEVYTVDQVQGMSTRMRHRPCARPLASCPRT